VTVVGILVASCRGRASWSIGLWASEMTWAAAGNMGLLRPWFLEVLLYRGVLKVQQERKKRRPAPRSEIARIEYKPNKGNSYHLQIVHGTEAVDGLAFVYRDICDNASGAC
jgi:hypothetical protein